MTQQYQYGSETFTIQLELLSDGSYLARIGEREIRFYAQQNLNGQWLIQHQGKQIPLYTASEDDRRYVQVNGTHYTLEAVDTRKRRRGSSGSSGDLTAQMPGQVVDVLVETGATVEKGQTLLILEAMKMEIRVSVPMAGEVKVIHVSAGDVVERGQVLIEVG